MSDMPKEYGLLYNKNNIKLHRMYFKQMTKLIGINCLYRAPKRSKTFDTHGDLDTKYEAPVPIGCIFEAHPDQKTLKKMGWVSELQESSSIIHVPYDLPGLEIGALFIVPGGLDNSVGRMFRVISMQNIMMYPASIACEIAPEYIDASPKEEVRDFTQSNFTKLLDNEEDD